MTSANASPLLDPDAMQAWFGGRIPIVIGAVGHRDLNSADKTMVKAVRKQCALLRRKYRDSPFLVLSGLAEGADRLIATVVMEELGAKLIAVLPFPADAFCCDFKTEESRQEFLSLIARSAATFDVHLPSNEEWKQAGPIRDEQYARVGALIAEQSQILLALWGGNPPRGVGGTGHVVAWFERGCAPSEYSIYGGNLSLFDPPQPGLSIRIDPITGESEIHNARRPSARPRRYSLLPRSSINEILARTQSYNRDVRRQAADSDRTPLVPPGILERVPFTEAAAAFEQADALAIYYGRRVRLADRVLYLLALAAVFAFSSIDAKPLASWAFLAVMGVMAVVAIHVRGRSLDTKFLEYRSLAEAMRILYFWRMLGIKQQVWLSYLSKHGFVVRWLRHAVRGLEFTQDRRLTATPHSLTRQELHTIAIERWIYDQINYFKAASAKSTRHYWRWTWVQRVALILTFASSALLAAMTFGYSDNVNTWREGARIVHPFGDVQIGTFIQRLQTLVGLAAAAGVAARGFLIRSADLEFAKQFATTRETFEVALNRIAEIRDEDAERELPEVFERLGREALLEQAEWLWLRHSRPFEAPS